MIAKNGVIVLQHTTMDQLEEVKEIVMRAESKAYARWLAAQGEADCTDQIHPDIDHMYNALNNFCADLEILGYERS